MSIIGVTLLLLALFPRDSDAVSGKAIRFYERGDLERAAAILSFGVKKWPEDAQLHFMLGNAYFRQRRWADAAEAFSEARRLRPGHADTLINLGCALDRSGDPGSALLIWRRAAAATSEDALPHLFLAVEYSQQDLPRRALGHMTRALMLDSNWKKRIEFDIRWTNEMVRTADMLSRKAFSSNGGPTSQRQ